MTDIRRTLLWVVFSMSLFLIWDAWNKHNGHPSFFSPAPARPAQVGAAPNNAAGALGANPGALPAGSATAAPAVSEKVDITTDLVKATLDSKGADLVRLELLTQHNHVEKPWFAPFLELFGKGDKSDAEPKSNVVVLEQSAQHFYVAQTGLWPTAAGPGTLPEHHTVMHLVPGERTLKDGANELQVKFESPEVDGVKLVKTYTFKRGEYLIQVKHEVVNGSSKEINPRLYLQLVRDGKVEAGNSFMASSYTGPAIYTDAAKFMKLSFEDIKKGKASFDKMSNDGWVSMIQHYFTSAWLVPAGQPREFFAASVPNANDEYAVGMFLPLGAIAPGATKAFDAQLFVGPQEEDKLSAIAPGLERVKDYGRLTILSQPLFWLLTKLHNLIGNWGWAIVALVVVLKAAFYWLNAYAYRSMAKMKGINPRIMALRERLKDKPQQMQQEMMRIYKEEGVSPIGGCLPIIVQMPFFIALYWVLLSSVEMRNAPWIGWITDLSAKDPYFILPLLMTASSLLQTWLNPTPPDPMQARMMWIMPLLFSVMFFFFPAGLVLYWLTNNILSIAQQYLINKRLGVLGK